MSNVKYLYCSKNVLAEYENSSGCDVFDCYGPNGIGIEDSCLKTCTNACDNEAKLIEQIGLVVLMKLGYK